MAPRSRKRVHTWLSPTECGRRLRLELLGAFEVDAVETFPTHESICGICKRGVTLLLNAECVHKESLSNVDVDTEWIVRRAYLGIPAEVGSEPVFSDVCVHYSTIDVWARRLPFSHSSERGEDGGWNVRQDYHQEPPRSIGRCGPFDVTLEALFSIPGVGVGSTECSIKQEMQVRFRATSSQPLSDFLDASGRMLRFLTLSTNTKTAMTGLLANAETADYPYDVDILVNGLGTAKRKAWGVPDCLLNLSDLGASPATRVLRWFERDRVMDPVTGILTMCIEWGNEYSWIRSLFGIEALEAYDRRASGSRNTQLRARLHRLVNQAAGLLGTIPSDHEDYVDSAYDIRTYFSHWNTDMESTHFTGSRLEMISNWAEIILEALLLRDIGFEGSTVRKLLWTRKPSRWKLAALFPSHHPDSETSK